MVTSSGRVHISAVGTFLEGMGQWQKHRIIFYTEILSSLRSLFIRSGASNSYLVQGCSSLKLLFLWLLMATSGSPSRYHWQKIGKICIFSTQKQVCYLDYTFTCQNIVTIYLVAIKKVLLFLGCDTFMAERVFRQGTGVTTPSLSSQQFWACTRS